MTDTGAGECSPAPVSQIIIFSALLWGFFSGFSSLISLVTYRSMHSQFFRTHLFFVCVCFLCWYRNASKGWWCRNTTDPWIKQSGPIHTEQENEHWATCIHRHTHTHPHTHTHTHTHTVYRHTSTNAWIIYQRSMIIRCSVDVRLLE